MAMENDAQAKILEKLEEQERKIDKITRSIHIMRQVAMWRFVILIFVFIILPVVGITIALPKLNELLEGIINAVNTSNQKL